MSQRRALIASILLTLVLAFSAIGIRAVMTDAPAEDAAAKSPLPVLVPGSDTRQGDDGTNDGEWRDDEGDEDHEDRSYASTSSNDNDRSSTRGETEHEENDHDD